MKLLKGLLLLVTAVSLIGCTPSKPNGNSNQSEPSQTGSDSIARLEYVNRIEKPSSTVKTMAELAEIVDYNTFYHNPDFKVTIASDFEYKTQQKAVKNEINYLYWYSELVNGTTGIMGTDNKDGTWSIHLTFYENAVVSTRPSRTLYTDLFYQEPEADLGEYTYKTDDESKPIADVYTSQQLWYAAEHNYRINVFADSPAEKYYNKSKEVLKKLVTDEMTDYEKTMRIYDYIEHHATYSYQAAYDLPDSKDPVNYPDDYAATYKAYYLEGFFDDACVVCDGFSKVYTLLGKMAGLEIVRAIGTSDKSWTSKEVAGHAYCYVKINGRYYLSCPTWGQSSLSNGAVVTNKKYFLSPKNYIRPYDSNMWEDFTFTSGSSNINYFKLNKVKINNTDYSAYISSIEELNAVTTLFEGSKASYMNLCFDNENLLNSISSSRKYTVIKIENTLQAILYIV